MEENHAREYYIKIQTLQKHIEQLNGHKAEVDEKRAELANMLRAVKEAQTITADDEILVPLTNGIFIPAKPTGEQTFILNVGANTAVEKNGPATEELLQKQDAELVAYQQQLTAQQESLRAELVKLEEQVMEDMSDNV